MTDTDPTPQTPAQLREYADRMRAERDEARQAAQAAEATKRENAMLKAGVDLAHPAAAYFVDGYKGELDPEAIKAEWAKVAPPAATPPVETPPADAPPSDGPTPEELALQRQREQLNSGAEPPGTEQEPDPVTASIRGYQEARRRGDSQIRAQTEAIQRQMNAAAAGDPRITSNSAEEATARWKRRHGFE